MNLRAFLTRLKETREEEILCSECLDGVAEFVDLELDGQPASRLMPLLKQHLDQCPVCMEEYLLLRELAEDERGGAPLSLEQLLKEIALKKR